VLCLKNEDCEDLLPRKIYQVLTDEASAEDDYIRVIDESGEDYLYPQDYFVHIELPQAARKALLSAAKLATTSPCNREAECHSISPFNIHVSYERAMRRSICANGAA
jgi:hypothetical protein